MLTFTIIFIQVRMTAQSEDSGISTVNQVMGCWSGQTGSPAATGPVVGQEIQSHPPMSLSCEEKLLLHAGGKTASPGAAETGKLGAGWER